MLRIINLSPLRVTSYLVSSLDLPQLTAINSKASSHDYSLSTTMTILKLISMCLSSISQIDLPLLKTVSPFLPFMVTCDQAVLRGRLFDIYFNLIFLFSNITLILDGLRMQLILIV